MTNAEKARQAALDRVGDAYVYGAWDQYCTVQNRNKYAKLSDTYADKIKQYCPRMSGEAPTCDGCKYLGHRIHDCRGLTSTCAKAAGITTITGQTVGKQWAADTWALFGLISELPDVPYAQLFRYDGQKWAHTGCYIGNGETVDARSHAKGVIRGKLSDYKWTHWAIPKGMEEDATYPTADAVPPSQASWEGKEEEAMGKSIKPYSAVVSVKSGRLNLRNAPNTSGDIVERLPNGTPLTVICEYENGWAFVDEDGTQGYVCMDYIKPVNKPESAQDAPDGGGVQTPTDEDWTDDSGIADSQQTSFVSPDGLPPSPEGKAFGVWIPCDREEEARRYAGNIKGAIVIRYEKGV